MKFLEKVFKIRGVEIYISWKKRCQIFENLILLTIAHDVQATILPNTCQVELLHTLDLL